MQAKNFEAFKAVSPKTAPAGVRERNMLINIVSTVDIVISSLDLKSVNIIDRVVLMLYAWKICETESVRKAIVIAVELPNFIPER
mgnify:CR=1 FL=1